MRRQLKDAIGGIVGFPRKTLTLLGEGGHHV